MPAKVETPDLSYLAGKYILVDLETEIVISAHDDKSHCFEDAKVWAEECMAEGANPPAMAIYLLEEVLVP